jgi:hypothetical protein
MSNYSTADSGYSVILSEIPLQSFRNLKSHRDGRQSLWALRQFLREHGELTAEPSGLVVADLIPQEDEIVQSIHPLPPNQPNGKAVSRTSLGKM